MTQAVPPDTLEAHRAPFIDRSIDNTALAAYMRCPREFYYSMILHRRKRGNPRPALAYGTTWHAILQAHYRTGGNYDAVLRAAVASWEPHDNPDDHRTLERALSSYNQYLERWGDHEADSRGWGKTVGYPDAPVVENPTELWWPGALHPYAGKIDRIYEHQGLYYVEDHKTTSALGKTYFRQFDPSNQMMGYAWLATKLTGLPIAGVRINAHAVLKTESKFERQTIMFAQDRLEDWARNYNHWISDINNRLGMLKDGTLKEVSGGTDQEILDAAFPYNFNACAGKYGPCPYVEVDTMPVKIRRRVLENDYELAPWDPMRAEDEE